ncbi:hypothetical protein Pla100_10130 [Neorhodopirellula pilleata]|uniref:Uncharacterized protein n=1 Tax=Neorhodopirellula pilleata TaxID=2714738 RepID=A0A5C6AX36_9BACT|nr:hypothetical protein Pla100_10130 [Neorhodopirellula pilleata]
MRSGQNKTTEPIDPLSPVAQGRNLNKTQASGMLFGNGTLNAYRCWPHGSGSSCLKIGHCCLATND